jgi:hypothetical protein
LAKRKKIRKARAYSPNVLDYPSSMSLYERESLAAEAKLIAKKATKRKPIQPLVERVL